MRTPKTRETVSLSAHGTKHIESNAVLFITVACLTGPKVGGGVGGGDGGTNSPSPKGNFHHQMEVGGGFTNPSSRLNWVPGTPWIEQTVHWEVYSVCALLPE
ncbi:hypothetical protein CEXT_145801 [Caerostris extrusa]|uniref:Uncharacterized protein n=1 Tax=Caerostris extrusa TaxID=172846 RepID=A0AAV4WAB0_CAEEX|nr:hypothetical protein CEXT_145801 [Caerostris extrusa]